MKKKIVFLTLLVVLTLALAPSVFAVDEQEPVAPMQAPYYLEFSGKVTDINPYYNLDGSESSRLFVLTESSDGMPMNFVVDDKTVFLTENELKVGADIVGFYLGNAPAIMIYPPQMHAEVMAVDLPPAQSVKAAMFDENGLSDDGQLKLNISTDTQFELPDGSPAIYSDPFYKPWVVFYSVTTRSLPPQTTPSRIIVLPAEKQQPAQQPEDAVVDGMPLVVENVQLKDAPPVYVHDSGTVMIPLRAVAEALGYEVGWQNGVVLLDGQAVIVIGQKTFTFDTDAPMQLTTAAELRTGVTYVPLSFFREVLGLNNAYVLEKQVFIDNGEKME